METSITGEAVVGKFFSASVQAPYSRMASKTPSLYSEAHRKKKKKEANCLMDCGPLIQVGPY